MQSRLIKVQIFQVRHTSFLLNCKEQKTIYNCEELVLPVAARMTEIIHVHKYADKFKNFPLADTAVSRRIEDISKDKFE